MNKADDIVAIIGFYQDGKAGQRLIKVLDSYDIPSIWADGRINGFNKLNNSNLSTDGFREIILSYKNTTLLDIGLHGPGDLTNRMLIEAGDQGYGATFTFGCDEYITGDWNLMRDNLNRGKPNKPIKCKIPIIEHNPAGNHNQNHIAERLTTMPKFVHVKGIHWLFWSFYNGEDRMLGDQREDPLILGVDLHHDDTIRDKWRNQEMDKFQVNQVARERLELKDIIGRTIIERQRQRQIKRQSQKNCN